MTTWHDRLQIALTARGYGWPDLVKATKLAKPSVYAWKPTATKQTKVLDGGNAAVVCSFLRIRIEWLMNGIDPSGLLPLSDTQNDSTGAESSISSIDGVGMLKLASVARLKARGEWETIPQFDAGGAMGNGGLLLRDQPGLIHGWQVNREWLEKNARNNTGAQNLCIVTGFGDSMRPMYNPGDPLLVDIGVKSVEAEGVYFFRIGNDGFIKRLQRIPDENGMTLWAISQNKDYKDFPITERMDFEVLGKVVRVWCGTDY